LAAPHRLAGVHQALGDLAADPEAKGALDPGAHNAGKRLAHPGIGVNRDDAHQRRQGARIIRGLLAAGDREGGHEKGGDGLAQGRLPVDVATNIEASNDYVNSLHDNSWGEAAKNQICDLLSVGLQADAIRLL
jgi:hypothetical protein